MTETLEVSNSERAERAFSNGGRYLYHFIGRNDITVEENTYGILKSKNHEITLGNGHTIYFQNEYGTQS